MLRRQLVPVAQSGDPLDKGAGDRDVGHLAEEAFAAPLSAPDADADVYKRQVFSPSGSGTSGSGWCTSPRWCRAMRATEQRIRAQPPNLRGEMPSPRKSSPISTLVMGSNMLRMEAREGPAWRSPS